ncbi:hypothetical protein FOQG_18234 [Fusarium oxysporum f. sp. raphani 54005]|uniref:Uncharacterized protein n=1 Tax=Fusarium oxysporum f. sp. raphani 54005 TaxID=1089458 RepID=X0BDZ1_FUSOX|nr:hypothetical protein FOQG_18234 [Fusarium oxysporum f. sp. raphani 54005]
MSDKQPRRRGRPKKIRTEEERLAAQRRHTRTYYDRLQQEDVGSVPYAKFYQYAPHTSATSSTGPQLLACCTPPDSSAFLPSNDPENPDDESDPFMVGGSTRGQMEVNYDDVGFCLSDTDSAISQASDAFGDLDETCGLSLPDLSAEQARNHRQQQQDEGVEELLETVEKSLHISTPADTCQDEIDELHTDNELFGHNPQNLGARYDESSALTLERYLAQEWMTQPSCSIQAHEADHENLAKNECHRSCDSLDDVVARLDGLIDDDHSHDPLPYVMDPSSDLLNHASQPRTSPDGNALPDLGQLTSPHRPDYRAACQIALEGTLGDAITAAVQDPNILQYLPKSRKIAQSNSRARQEGISTEYPADLNMDADVLGQGRRTNALSYVLQHRHLSAIWEEVQSRTAAFPQFAGMKLYMGAKNLKLAYMNADINQTIHDWRNQWDVAIDQAFLDPFTTYIDIGRQYTPRIGSAAETSVFLWRRCCLKYLWRGRQGWSRRYNATSPPEQQRSLKNSVQSKPGLIPLRLAEYPKLTLRDTVDITIKPTDGSREVREGLIYSQFYNLIKIPFDAAKQYPFQNRHLEKMALTPRYY